MSRPFPRLRRLGRDVRGATMVEMALITPMLMMVLLGLTDMGYQSYLSSVLDGTVAKAARRATVGGYTSAQIDDYVRGQLTQFSKNATITITKTSYFQFSGIGKGEAFDPAHDDGNGTWDSGDCYMDTANFGTWDPLAGATGLGGSDDIVYYKVTVDFPRMFPLSKILGWSANEKISSTTIMRNQPYGAQIQPMLRGGTTQNGYCNS